MTWPARAVRLAQARASIIAAGVQALMLCPVWMAKSFVAPIENVNTLDRADDAAQVLIAATGKCNGFAKTPRPR